MVEIEVSLFGDDERQFRSAPTRPTHMGPAEPEATQLWLITEDEARGQLAAFDA